MNILFLSFIPVIPHFGGIQRVTDLLATELSTRGHNIFYMYYEYRDLPKDYIPKFPQYYLQTSNRNKADYIKDWYEYLAMNKIDVIINQNADDISCNLLSCTLSGITKISVNHLQPFAGLDYQRIIQYNSTPSSLKGKIYKLIGVLMPSVINYIEKKRLSKRIKMACDVSDKYCVLSPKYIDRIARFDETIDVSKCISIPNPIYNNGELNFDEKERIVLYVGRLTNNPKNVVSLLKSWKYIQEQEGWSLVIVGDGPDKGVLQTYCKKENLKNVFFEGNQTDVSQYYRKASIVCITSFNESWAMSLVEGMCYGVIPVAFDSYEAASTIIDNNKNGFLIKPFSYKEMANKIIQIINDPIRMQNMMENAIAKVNVFSVKNVADEWEKQIIK